MIPLFSALLASFWPRLALQTESFALKRQIIVLSRFINGPKLRPRDWFLWIWLLRLRSQWRSALIIVKPEKVISWHQAGFRLFRRLCSYGMLINVRLNFGCRRYAKSPKLNIERMISTVQRHLLWQEWAIYHLSLERYWTISNQALQRSTIGIAMIKRSEKHWMPGERGFTLPSRALSLCERKTANSSESEVYQNKKVHCNEVDCCWSFPST